MLLALAVFLAYQFIINRIYPPRPLPPASLPAETASEQGSTSQVASSPASVETVPASQPLPAGELAFVAGPSREPVVIGGRRGDALKLKLTPRGAAVASLHLTSRTDGRYVYRAEADGDEPCPVLEPVEGGTPPVSFATEKIAIREFGNRSWPLDDLVWSLDESRSGANEAVFTTTLLTVDGAQELLRLVKSYRLREGQPLVDLSLSVENVSDRPFTVQLVQHGPTGIRRESPMYDMRRLLAAQFDGQTVTKSGTAQRGQLRSKTGESNPVELFSAVKSRTSFAWVALANRFFGVFIRWLPEEGAGQHGAIWHVDGILALPASEAKLGDLLARLTTTEQTLSPAQQVRYAFEVYAGPKDPEILRSIDPEFVDRAKVYYTLVQAADQRCCTFEPLPSIMVGLLHAIHFVVRNYGVAIVILVLIVRTLLHPLSVYQQKNMFRMQEAMARLKPKLDAVKEKYANDRTRLNQEMMKVYAEEGVNPMGTLVGMLPMLIQMPILVALWTGLNMDIRLRHAPLDGWWINDLASPDALVEFAAPLTLPILGWLPLIGWMFQDIPSLNLLPILMGVSMWLQQKYLPKPGAQAKPGGAVAASQSPRKPGQLSPEDQLRQQQIMNYMMSIMFPLMFYYMPAGLNLYWMATNVFGIGESLIIRRQLEQERQRRAQAGPAQPPKRSGLVGRLLKRMAEQAEQLQKKADALTEASAGGSSKDKPAKKR